MVFALCAKCDLDVRDRSDVLCADFGATLIEEHAAFGEAVTVHPAAAHAHLAGDHGRALSHHRSSRANSSRTYARRFARGDAVQRHQQRARSGSGALHDDHALGSVLGGQLDLLGADQAPALRFFPGMDLSSAHKARLFARVLRILGEHFQLVAMSTHARAILARDALAVRPALDASAAAAASARFLSTAAASIG